jgi:tetratricopeptide (TPR) repeat protein/TolB-like protein
LLGTPYYMAPEQFDADGPVDIRSDLYALGATLYQLACGRPPFEGNGVLALAEQHRRKSVVWSDECIRTVPAWLRNVVVRCLAKRPEDRFASAGALLEALQAGEAHAVPIRSPAACGAATASHNTLQPRGIVVMTFRNLSGCDSDDWIGEAVAEYLTERLMELEGIHVADRQSLVKILGRQEGASAGGGAGSRADSAEIIEAGRLVGAHSVIVGSFQRSGDALRITVHSISGSTDEAAPIGTFSGSLSDLFALEDEISTKVLELVGHGLRPARTRSGAGGTANVEAHEMYMRGRRTFADGDYRKAIELAERALASDPEYIEPLGFIGACWARLGEYDRAVEYHQRQEQTARQTDDRPRLAEAMVNLGAMYYYKGEYPLAYEFLDNARNLSTELNLSGDAAKYHGNLGFVLMRLNRFKEAETAFSEAIENSKRLGDLVSLIWPYNGMGGVLLKQQRYAEAREYYQRALALAEEVGDRVNVGVSQMNQGRCACLLGDYAEARRRFEAALSTLQKTDFWNGLALVHEYMAEMHLQQDDLDAALACIERRVELARRHGNNRMEAEAWEQKARAYEKRRQTDRALECLKRSLEASQRPAPYESLHRYLEEIAHRAPLR